jgi:cytochrome c-type protein NapC
MMKRKFQATLELYSHFISGAVDTREKFEANRCRLATNVWTRMKSTDSLECRNCHHDDAWNPDLQSDKSKTRHERARNEGKTCIECHFGIAHNEPSGDCPGPQDIQVQVVKHQQ